MESFSNIDNMKLPYQIILCLSIMLTACHQPKKVEQVETLKPESSKANSHNPQLNHVSNEAGSRISTRFAPLQGYERKAYENESFQKYLSDFPLLPLDEKIHLYDGTEKYYQDVHASILDIDVGNRDLQQCADAIMRLRSEYLFKQKRYDEIAFDFTNGWRFEYQKWRDGNKLAVNGNKTSWVKGNRKNESYKEFRSYLNQVFMYAGTLSLSKELTYKKMENIEIGDILIQGGSPGHAVVVVDLCIHSETEEKAIMLAQSYMPAQQIHILKNHSNPETSPWYRQSEMQKEILTPEWKFYVTDLMTF